MDKNIFEMLTLGSDGIYSAQNWGTGQETEIALRRKVASQVPDDLDAVIAIHHSFPVMDHEVEEFIKKLPQNGVILDVGGCWGWHWRGVAHTRPDIRIIIMDFVRENLTRAKYFLHDQINQSVFLVHGDGTKIPFANETFDGYWAVQTLQHIPALDVALTEAKRVLKSGGKFSMYNLNNPLAIRTLYKMLGRSWVDEGSVEGMFFLRRTSKNDARLIKQIFGNVSSPRYTEILFTPELNLHSPAKPVSWLGKVDAYLTSSNPLFRLIARQTSFSATKQ